MARTTRLRFGTTVVVVVLGVAPVVVALDFGQTRYTAAVVAESTTRPCQSVRAAAPGEQGSSLSPRTIDKIIGKTSWWTMRCGIGDDIAKPVPRLSSRRRRRRQLGEVAILAKPSPLETGPTSVDSPPELDQNIVSPPFAAHQ